MRKRQPIECALIRGGTSKGVYLRLEDLPEDRDERLGMLQSLMGDDATQLDGLGGGNALSSKVALVAPSSEEGVDIDYHFVQVMPARGVDDTVPCGNILSGVGMFAVETGIVEAQDPTTTIVVRDVNTGAVVEQTIRTPDGRFEHVGDKLIPGTRVPGSPIDISYKGISGKITGKLFPTGNVVDDLDGVPVTLIDGPIPVVMMPGGSVGLEMGVHMRLGNMRALIDRLLLIRARVSGGTGIDHKNTSMPKVAVLYPPTTEDADIAIRYFTPHTPHSSIAVTGGISIAIAAAAAGTITHKMSTLPEVRPEGGEMECRIEHFAGITPFRLKYHVDGQGWLVAQSATLVRTSRLLMRGTAYIAM